MTTAKKNRSLLPPARRPAPWLVIPNGADANRLNFFNVSDSENNSYIRTCEENLEKNCVASMHGWLVMMDLWISEEVHCFLWNPDTREKIDLPSWDVEAPEDIGTCILLSPPTTPDCMVLFVVKKSFLTWQLGDKKWTKQNYELGRTHHGTEEYIVKAISCKDGIIYALTTQSVAVIIDRKSCGTLSVRSLDFGRPQFSATIRLEKKLVESRGDIYLVVILYVGHKAIQVAHVEVFKMDLYKKVWVKVESIGHQVFFVAECGSISLPATNLDLKGNCIYFSISADDLLYVFDLEDGNLSNYLPCPNLATPSFTPFWYLPNNWLVEIQKEDVNTVPKTELEMEMADNKFATVEEPVEESIGFRWINLPMDILRSIAMCLHSSADFVNFGRVCKSFASSIPQSPLTTQYPQLMFSNRTSLCSFCDPMHNVTYCFDMPDLLGARIRFSKDGWCLMSKGDYSMFFFNPFTKVTVTLPDLPPKHWANDGFSFTQVPTSPDCIVFGIAGFHKFFVQILYLHLGENAWTQEYRENEVEFFPSNNNLVFHDGAFYCLGAERYLGVFDLRDNKWTILLTPEPCSSTQKNYLVESDGEILSVFVGREGKYVNIYKLDRLNLNWEVLRNLEDQMLFVSHSTSILMNAVSERMQNKIYFPMSFGNKNNCLFYSLETRKWNSSLGDYFREDTYNTEEKLHCTWI